VKREWRQTKGKCIKVAAGATKKAETTKRKIDKIRIESFEGKMEANHRKM
jgi:hypothetical protein